LPNRLLGVVAVNKKVLKIFGLYIFCIYIYILKHKNMQVHSILAVQKLTTEHAWFNLITTRNQRLTVYDGDIHWSVEEDSKTPEIVVYETDESGQVIRCMIAANKEQLENIMYSLGYALPNRANDSVYISTVSEVERNLRMALYDLEELLKSKQNA
jgi:hypothetical protein